LNILYIAPSFIPSRTANSVHVMKMCQAIAYQGHKVSLITRGIKNNKVNDYDYYGVKPNFKLYKLKINNYRFISSFIFSIYIYYKIIIIKPELIYSRHRFSLIVTRFFNHIPMIFEDHSPPSGIYKSLIKNSINSNIYKIVLISNALENLYKKILPSIKRVKVVIAHDGADPINKKIVQSKNINLKINKSKINCGYIGHLYEGRGIGIILEIAKYLTETSFHIVGGNESDVNFWRSKNMRTNVIFHGYVNNNKIPSILNQFDILLAPYQKQVLLENKLNTAQWMSPLKIFEYMAAGKPIICSDLLVIKEILTHRVNALLVNSDNPKEWVQSIIEVCSDSSLSNQLGQRARIDLLKDFTWKIRAKKILNE
jgi:glycosyltransferase involved in cell wall biosynthesis